MNKLQGKLLLIENSSEDRVMIRRALAADSDYSYTMHEAANGAEGLRLWREHRPDCVLLNYQLPDMDGMKLLTALNPDALNPRVPVILLITTGHEALAAQAIKSGAQSYLVKEKSSPIELQIAIQQARDIVTLRRQHKQATEESRTSEAKFAAAFHHSSLPMSIVSEAEVVYLDVNQACAALFGLSRQEMIGHAPAELDVYSDPAQRLILRSLLERDGFVRDFEVKWQTRQGGIRTHLLNADRITLNGQPCIFVVSNDITDRKQTEEELRRKQAELTDFIENAAVGLHWVDANGIIIWANRAEMELLGYSAEEYIGHSITEFHADNNTINDILARLKVGETLCNYEASLRRKDGSLCDVLINSNVLWQNGKFVHTRCFTRDISERKQGEEVLREAEEGLRLATEAAEMYSWVIDLPDRTIKFAKNQAQILGFALPETFSKALAFVHPEDRVDAERAFDAELQNTENFETEYRLIHPQTGAAVWVCTTGVVITDAHGAPLRLVGVTQNITSRKEAEEKLRQSEERYHSLFASVDQGFCIIEMIFDDDNQPLDYHFIETNPMFEQQTGLKNAVGKKARELVPKLEAHWFEIYGRVALTGEPVRFVDGSDAMNRWFDVYAARLGDASSRKVAVLFADITERLQIERKINESEANFRELAEAVPQFVWATEADGKLSYVNQQWLNFANLTLAQTRDATVMAAIYHPDDRQAIEAAWQEAFANRTSFEMEARMKDPQGVYHWFLIRAVTIKDEAGNVVKWFGTSTDITANKQAEEALRASDERFRLAADAAHALVYDVDYRPDGRIAAYGFASLFGTDPSEQITREWYRDQVHPDDLSLLRTTLADATNGNEYNVQYRLRHAEGHYIYVEDNGRLILNDKGQIVRGIGTLMDSTERKRAETERERLLEQEQRARETAEAATRAKDEFLAVVSHELRNPLNAILGYTRLTRTNPHDIEQVVRHCEIIHRNAKMQQQLIEDLLDTTRISSGKLKIEAAPTDLHFVLQEAMTVVLPAAAAKQIELVDRLGDKPQAIIGDAARLQQIAWNLLQNAIKFTPERGRVELRLERSDQQVRIIVSDTGRGIEPEFLPAVFDRFSQNDMSRTRRYGGLGLGLALTKQLVELHGGTIEVLSAGLGLGATFTVTLPLLAPQSTHYQPPMRAIAAIRTDPEAIPLTDLPRLDNVRVLVVDDQEEARLMVAITLREWGAVVTTAASGDEARALLDKAEFDVLVCDIAMPDEDGYELIGKIRTLESQRGVPHLQRLPAVALTARARPEDLLQALRAGFQMHIAKPVELAELVVVIHSLCNH